MRWELRYRQKALFENGLLGKVSVAGVLLLDYFQHWRNYEGTKRIECESRIFFWVQYNRAIDDLPGLFSPDLAKATNINRVSLLVDELRKVGLLETRKRGPRLFFLLTPLAERLFLKRAGEDLSNPSQRTSKGHDRASEGLAITKTRESPITCIRDNPVTEIRETNAPLHIDETTIRKKENENTPRVPKGDEDVSIDEGIRILLRCLDRDPGEQLSANELRAVRRHGIRMSAREGCALKDFYAAAAFPREPLLAGRKKKFSTLVSDLRGQISLALKMFPLPVARQKRWTEPPLEVLHAWLRKHYPNAVLQWMGSLDAVGHSNVIEEFLTDHPEYRCPGANGA